MAQNKNSKNSDGMCKKIYNAITPFRSTARRVSRQNNENPTKIPSPQISKMIPIEAPSKSKKMEDLGEHKEIVIANSQKVANKYKKDDDFSNYIRKVKSRMIKTASNIGGGDRTATKRDSFNDKVTNYIDHSKMKIRTTTTSVGHIEKNVSFK
ncbi:hypothetical protein BUALT_Bualt13G0010500 [Buddleja alternifolia]|uniref:Uncharacterized protein n=1 Tax=Buddleja alternifolia TaxID=168488 RepID=A0AAV6WSA1_9LAMI|nr:hypothetical protein BUALT_Bualt13G0010500 [Buddleja alternifolia]